MCIKKNNYLDMKNIRLIGSIFSHNNKCFQTTEYFNYRPLGQINNILEIFNQHNVDEIIINNRTDGKLENSLLLLKKIKESRVYTPIVYSGGINNANDVQTILKFGIDRIAINSSLWKPNKLPSIINAIGKQGVIAVLPFRFRNNEPEFFYSQKRIFKKLDLKFIDFLKGLEIEILLIDTFCDGKEKGFNLKVLNLFSNSQLILQGGILNPFLKLEQKVKKDVVAISIENRLLWEELKAINIRTNNDFFIKREMDP